MEIQPYVMDSDDEINRFLEDLRDKQRIREALDYLPRVKPELYELFKEKARALGWEG